MPQLQDLCVLLAQLPQCRSPFVAYALSALTGSWGRPMLQTHRPPCADYAAFSWCNLPPCLTRDIARARLAAACSGSWLSLLLVQVLLCHMMASAGSEGMAWLRGTGARTRHEMWAWCWAQTVTTGGRWTRTTLRCQMCRWADCAECARSKARAGEQAMCHYIVFLQGMWCGSNLHGQGWGVHCTPLVQ